MADNCNEEVSSILVSVIIPAFNEERNIVATLESIKKQTLSKSAFEIIVADNGSTDQTVDIAKSFGAKVVVEPKCTVGALRNKAALIAKGQILAFLDADCIPTQDWLSNAVKAMAEGPCVTGSNCHAPENASWHVKAWFAQDYVGNVRVRHINSGNMFVPKSIFEQLKGFDPTLRSGEDFEFCVRASKLIPIVSDEGIKVFHMANHANLLEFVKKQIWHGMGALGTIADGGIDKPLLGSLVFIFLTVGQLFGLVAGLCGYSWVTLTASTLGLILLVLLSAVYRRTKSRYVNILLLAPLFYFYYLGRGIALLFLLCGKSSYHPRRN